MTILINLAHPVRPDCPDWRSNDGESLAFCIGRWLAGQIALGRVPKVADDPAPFASGKFCGVRVDDEERGPCLMITQSAVTACVTELGLECATPQALHHVLFDLVSAGLLHQQVMEHRWPGVGAVSTYCFSAGILSIDA